MKNALLVLSLSLGIPAMGEYYDHEVTDTATTFQETLQSGDVDHQYVSGKKYKVTVLEGEVVPVTVTFSMRLVSCSSGSFNVYLNDVRCQPNGTKYELNLTADAYIRIETWGGNPVLIAPGREASTYFCEATYTLKATFPPRYTVRCLPGTGGVTGVETVTKYPKDKTATLGGETYFRLGYRQRGWTSLDQGPKAHSLGATVKMDRNYELYPYWEAVSVYTIRYLPGAQATGVGTETKKTQGLPVPLLKSSPFKRDGYVQTGWASADGGEKTYDMGAQYLRDLDADLYPYWETGVESVTFRPGAKGIGGSLVEYKRNGSSLRLHGPIYSRKGYLQCGWSESDGGERKYRIYDEYPTHAATTLYPVWKPDPAADRTYMVVDLSGGSSAASYPISYLADVPAGGWSDEYKTSKLVLRRIPVYAASESGVAVKDSAGRESHEPYYIGIFEMTQKQYALIVGSVPKSSTVGDTVPVDGVSMRTIHSLYRSATPFMAAHYDYASVSDSSVFGCLRAKTGDTSFDLPSQSMLEYAAAGGMEGHGCSVWYDSTTGEFVDSITDVAFFDGTNPQKQLYCAAVGRFKPGNWGIYDAYGNAGEWTTTYEIDGNTSSDRKQFVFGGNGRSTESTCRQGGLHDPATYTGGFRVCCKAPAVTVETYEISYRPGEYGVGIEQDEVKVSGRGIELKGAVFTRNGYVQSAWQDADGRVYAFGALYETDAPLTLYPVWRKDAVAPSESVYYVDAAGGDDSHSGASWANAFASIQRGVEVCPAGSKIIVADGVYGAISTGDKKVRICSQNGPARCVIDASRSYSEDGTGRCATLADSYGEAYTNSVLEGFTLINGSKEEGGGSYCGTLCGCIVTNNYAMTGGGAYGSFLVNCTICDNIAEECGGGCCRSALRGCNIKGNMSGLTGGGVQDGTAFDCVFFDNYSDTGGAAYRTEGFRCVFRENSAWTAGGAVEYGSHENCLFVGNFAANVYFASYGGAGRYGAYTNCTFYGNSADYGPSVFGGALVNSIVYANFAFSEGGSSGVDGGCTYDHCCLDRTGASGIGNMCAEPAFENEEDGDFRLRAESPCIDAGRAVDVGTHDLAGMKRLVGGGVDIGAYEYQGVSGTGVTPDSAFWQAHPSILSAAGGNTEIAKLLPSPGSGGKGKFKANGEPLRVWEDYVAGTNPENSDDVFTAMIEMVDGEPVITWTPDLNEGGTKSLRTYRTLGISDLSQSADPVAWREVAPGNESAYKFFKVEVNLK